MSSKGRYSFLDRFNLNSIYNLFLGLPPQQQTIAMIGAGVLAVVIILLPISLASNKIGKMRKGINKSSDAMADIVREIEDYENMQGEVDAMESSLKAGYDKAMSTTLESLASKSGIQDNIESIKDKPVVPSELFDESVVDVRLSKVTLPQLIDFLYSIEYDKRKILRVKDLRMKTRFDDKKLFDVTFQVSTFKLLKEKEGE